MSEKKCYVLNGSDADYSTMGVFSNKSKVWSVIEKIMKNTKDNWDKTKFSIDGKTANYNNFVKSFQEYTIVEIDIETYSDCTGHCESYLRVMEFIMNDFT